MANKVTCEIVTSWQDAAGKIGRFSFHVELAGGASAPNLTTITAAAKAVIDKLEAASDCKFLGAAVVLGVNPTVTGGKANADADSRARRHASTTFRGALSDNGVAEIVEIQVPDPKDAAIDNSLPRPGLKTSFADVQTYITAVTNNARTRGGETVASYKGSLIRQLRATKRTRQ